MESTAAALERAASGHGEGVKGVVRVTASEVIGVEVLPPIVTQLHGMDRSRFDIRTDSDLAQLALIRAGAGIGVCQVALAKRGGKLVRLLPRVFQFKLETWVTMHEDLRQSARCKVVFDALVEGLRAYA